MNPTTVQTEPLSFTVKPYIFVEPTWYSQVIPALDALVPLDKKDWRTRIIRHLQMFHPDGIDLSEDESRALDSICHYYRKRAMMEGLHRCDERCESFQKKKVKLNVIQTPLLTVNAPESSNIQFSRVWAMPNKDTFSIKPIGQFVWKYLSQSTVSIDPFARNKRWATYTNDLNPETEAQYHLDVLSFLEEMKRKGIVADLVILDPPYSLRQVKECYDGIGKSMSQRESQGFYGDIRGAVNGIIGADTIVLSFGWNTIGMGKKNGFEPIEIMLVCHGRAHNDTICMAERRIVT